MAETTLEVDGIHQVPAVRDHVAGRLRALGFEHLVDDAHLVVSELVTNALLHGGGRAVVRVLPAGDGVRAEVADGTRLPPVIGPQSDRAMTGRGLRLVRALADRWGVDVRGQGKVVWAELSSGGNGRAVVAPQRAGVAPWLEAGGADGPGQPEERRYHVELGSVPLELLLEAKAHVDNLVREFSLAAAGAASGVTAELPTALGRLVEAVVDRFAEARLAIKHQAVAAARAGLERADLALDLPLSIADAADDYLRALDEADAYCRAARLLTLETPPQHRVFRQWYVEEMAAQLRAAAAGTPHRPRSFEERLLAEIDEVARARRVSDRAARLYAVAGALASAATPESVAEAVLTEGAAALGAAGGGLLLLADADRFAVPATVGYAPELVEQLRAESQDAELPAAVALRTGESVWLETREDRDARFPELADLERWTAALCAVPLVVDGRRIGAVRFSFREPRLFDEDERRFVHALAAQCGPALERARLHRDRADVSQRLQRSLLPPALPDIPGVETAAVYRAFGDGVEVGGDFYDAWEVSPGRFAIAVGDAAGTGPEAAAVTALARHTLRALSMHQGSPEAVMVDLNTAMRRSSRSDEAFCTAVFGSVTVDDGVRFRLASGGHPHPLVRRADGVVEEIELDGSFIGAVDEIAVGVRDVVLGPGETIAFFTDGVTDARRDGRFFDVDGIAAVLTGCEGTAAETAAAIEAAVLAHAGERLADDMALLVLRSVP